MFGHVQCLLDVPGSELLGLADDGQALALAKLGGTYLQTHRALVFGGRAQGALPGQYAVGKGRAVHIGVLGYVEPVVVDGVATGLLGGKLEAVGNDEPLVAQLLVAAAEAVVVVDVGAGLGTHAEVAAPVRAVMRGELVLGGGAGVVLRQEVQNDFLAEGGLVVNVK